MSSKFMWNLSVSYIPHSYVSGIDFAQIMRIKSQSM